MKKVFNNFIKFVTKNKLIVTLISIILIISICSLLFFLNYKNNKNESSEGKELCYITFDTSGGTQIKEMSFECGSIINDPNVYPKKEGFTFMGWTYLNQPFVFGEKYNENIVLLANYMPLDKSKILTISFDTDGGTQIRPIEVTKDTTINPPLNPTKNGYDFDGWYLDETKFDFNTKITKNITLKAKWKKNDHFNNNTNINSTPSNYKCKGGYSSIEEKKNVSIGYKDHVNWTFSTGVSYSTDSCFITYKSSDKTIANVSNSGLITALKAGKVYIYQCINDSETKKEIGCFKGELTIKGSSHSDNDEDDNDYSTLEEEMKKAMDFANAINGYYWYLDGYEYAYLYPTIIDWYDHTLLNWDSRYIDLQNDKFVTSEETGIAYYNDDDIHNKFLANPTELGYYVFEQYNMKVSQSKLYITVGGKTYSFTKHSSKKNEKVSLSLSLSSNQLTIDKGNSGKININIKNSFLNHNITTSSSNSSIAACYGNSHTNNGIIQLTCDAYKPGNVTIKIKDNISGNYVNLNVIVNNVVIPVKGITLNNSSLDLLRGSSSYLFANINPANADNKSVIWTSSNKSVATVSSIGKVTAVGKGTAIITATTEEGGFTATCIVNVTNPPLTAKASIGVSTIMSSGSIARGINVTITANGGTGSYNYYLIKLYKDGNLISQSTNPNTYKNTLFVEGYTNGTYYAEYEVHDTEGKIYSGTSPVTTISGF